MKFGIVCYDISTNRFRTEFSKILILYGKRIQYSVFEFNLPNNNYKEMISDIRLFHKNYKKYCVSKLYNDTNCSIRVYLFVKIV